SDAPEWGPWGWRQPAPGGVRRAGASPETAGTPGGGPDAGGPRAADRPGDDEPFLPGKGLSADPPPRTEPDVPAPPARPGPMADPARRRALADAFVAASVGSAAWRATLAVLAGALPGRGMAAPLSRSGGEILRRAD